MCVCVCVCVCIYIYMYIYKTGGKTEFVKYEVGGTKATADTHQRIITQPAASLNFFSVFISGRCHLFLLLSVIGAVVARKLKLFLHLNLGNIILLYWSSPYEHNTNSIRSSFIFHHMFRSYMLAILWCNKGTERKLLKRRSPLLQSIC